jgi:Fur family transcriptional regulator, ferric uptake regulator
MNRGTNQKNAIRKALLNSGRPLSVQEIFELARNDAAGLGIATVYRNLKALQTEGLIIQVDLPGQPSRWEIAPEAHHHHFLCRTCDKLFEIAGCPEGLKHLLPKGYILEEHDILLRGQCDSCTGKLRSTTRNRKTLKP